MGSKVTAAVSASPLDVFAYASAGSTSAIWTALLMSPKANKGKEVENI
jgi:hypothetical protein